MQQTITAAHALQMADAMKQRPCTLDELVGLTGASAGEAAVARWLDAAMGPEIAAVYGEGDPVGSYRWVVATAHSYTAML